jgi:hypothetical protein
MHIVFNVAIPKPVVVARFHSMFPLLPERTWRDWRRFGETAGESEELLALLSQRRPKKKRRGVGATVRSSQND